MAALEGRYHSEPYIGKSHATFSKFPPGPSAVKQLRALENNEGKLQLGSLNQTLVTEKPSATSASGEKPITAQYAQQEFKQPAAIGIQKGAGPMHLRSQGSWEGVKPPGEDESPGQGKSLGGDKPPEQLKRRGPSPSDDGNRGEGRRGLSGEGRPPGGSEPPGGLRPPEQLGKRLPSNDGSRVEGSSGSSGGGRPSGGSGPPRGGESSGRGGPSGRGEATGFWAWFKRSCCQPCGNGVETSGDTSAAGVTSPLFLPNCLYPVATYHGTTDEVFPVHTGRTPKPSA
ncbi:hypothetical protein BJV77DRAFT_1023850 [Russula vinacea]|nr:hypothetical protein BJV77DRAFT_1023850 [Russula vinacea]